jgi:hypothetical protein
MIRLVLTPRMRITCALLQVVPIAGIGAIIAGWKNPQSRLLGRGILQAALFLFGFYPLMWPAAIALLWALWDLRLILAAAPPGKWSRPTRVPDAPDFDVPPRWWQRTSKSSKQARARTPAKAKPSKTAPARSGRDAASAPNADDEAAKRRRLKPKQP